MRQCLLIPVVRASLAHCYQHDSESNNEMRKVGRVQEGEVGYSDTGYSAKEQGRTPAGKRRTEEVVHSGEPD